MVLGCHWVSGFWLPLLRGDWVLVLMLEAHRPNLTYILKINSKIRFSISKWNVSLKAISHATRSTCMSICGDVVCNGKRLEKQISQTGDSLKQLPPIFINGIVNNCKNRYINKESCICTKYGVISLLEALAQSAVKNRSQWSNSSQVNFSLLWLAGSSPLRGDSRALILKIIEIAGIPFSFPLGVPPPSKASLSFASSWWNGAEHDGHTPASHIPSEGTRPCRNTVCVHHSLQNAILAEQLIELLVPEAGIRFAGLPAFSAIVSLTYCHGGKGRREVFVSLCV